MKPAIMANCMMNQNMTIFGSTGSSRMRNCPIAMAPYMPTCQEISDSVSALSASTMPRPGDRFRIGTIAKYWKTTPITKAKTKSSPQAAKIFSENRPG